MSAPEEIELKLTAEASNLTALRKHPRVKGSSHRKDGLESVYFDTPDGRLREAGYVLRVRKTKDGYVQTAKAAGDGLLERLEWEHPVEDAEPDRHALEGTPLAEVLGRKKKFVPLFTVSVERRAYQVEQGSSRIEVALDEGRITLPGGKRASDATSIGEVELELKKGSVADLFALAHEIGADVPLRLGVRTKPERGFALIDGEADGVRKAEAVPLTEDMNAADAFRAIAHACLRHMRLNEDVILDRRDPGALHQTRVAIRRLRSAFSLFGAMVADDRTETMRAELKRLSAPLGRARNLDVFLSRTLPAERARHPDEGGLLNLEKHLESQRTEAYEAVRSTLSSDEWRRFVLDLVAWINAGSWLTNGGDREARRRDKPAAAFAFKVLEKRRRQVKKRGRDLGSLGVEERHQVRIAAKKLRYGAEFFAGLYTGKKANKRHKAFLSALEDLQDALGDLNDIATGHEILDELASAEAGSALFAAGMTAADIEARTRKLVASAAEAHEALMDVRPFWR
jgi:triphosphatase